MSGARIAPGSGAVNVATGVPVLDHLLQVLARAGRFDLALEIDPDDAESEVASAGTALGAGVAAKPRNGLRSKLHRAHRRDWI